ncbi:class I SAM-dependent methyltransferase [candidate division KSB1 bacterium]|nr:class I SAM-dependent methyltransferase [candidate division KSB1 bacterium]
MTKRISTKENWDEFWIRKHRVEDVYDNTDRIITNLTQITELNGKQILEVGAGTARDSFAMIDAGADVFVLDYSMPAFHIIKRLNQQRSSGVYPILADTFKIPVAENTFDIVFHQGLLEHFTNPVELLKENVRVLKKDGLLLVDVPQRYHIYTVIKHILIFLNKWFAGWETEFTIRELESLVEQSGAQVVHRYGDWMRPSLFYRMVRELLLKIKIKLPLYPNGFGPLRRIRDKIRNRWIVRKWAFYTFLDIGIIASKNE